jgi:hypothetical protein
LVYTYISERKDGERKRGCILLLVGVEEFMELELPPSWSLRIEGSILLQVGA